MDFRYTRIQSAGKLFLGVYGMIFYCYGCDDQSKLLELQGVKLVARLHGSFMAPSCQCSQNFYDRLIF